jgi:hypothetical protein
MAPPMRKRHARSTIQSTPAAYTGEAKSPPEPNEHAEITMRAIPTRRRRSIARA